MRNTSQPLQTFFQINIRGTEDKLPDASQLAAFVDAYNRRYTVLRIASDSNYEAKILLSQGYRLHQRDKLRVRSFQMSSPFHAEFILLATSGAVAAIKYLAPIGLDIYKTIRENPKIHAEIAKSRAEAYKALAEGRKADAESKKLGAETGKLLQELSLVSMEQHGLVSVGDLTVTDPELSLERAKEVSEAINRNLAPDEIPDDLERQLIEYLPQARFPLSRALMDLIKSRFVIVQVEIAAIKIADGDGNYQSEE